MHLNNARVVITGASQGIGRAIALEFSGRGARVALAARNRLALDELASEIRDRGGEAVVILTDVTIPDQVERMTTETIRGLGGIGRERQAEIYLGGVRGRKPAVPVAAGLLEERAREAMSRSGFAYVAGGAGLENTIDANRAAFEQWRIVPRVLHDVAERQCGIDLFAQQLDSPPREFPAS